MLPCSNLRNFLNRAALIGSFALLFSVVAGVAKSEPSPMLPAAAGSSWQGGGAAVAIARRYLGATAAQLGLPSSLWCADFANLVRRKAGLRAPVSRRAIDQLQHTRRIAKPVPGALMITARGRRGHHVDWIVEVHGDGTVTTIGGNIGGRVAERHHAVKGLLAEPI